MGKFKSMLEYKADWYGKNIRYVGRFEPTSKMCSYCGAINKELQLKDRSWTCNCCGSDHDRDVNAVINIKNIGLRNEPSTVNVVAYGTSVWVEKKPAHRFACVGSSLRFSKSGAGSDQGDSDLDEPAELSFRFYLFIAWRFLMVAQAVSLKDAKPENHSSTYPIFALP
jgi:hypothetical protein